MNCLTEASRRVPNSVYERQELAVSGPGCRGVQPGTLMRHFLFYADKPRCHFRLARDTIPENVTLSPDLIDERIRGIETALGITP